MFHKDLNDFLGPNQSIVHYAIYNSTSNIWFYNYFITKIKSIISSN